MVTARSGWVVVGLLFVLPWTTWVGLTTTNPHDAVTQTPLWGFALGGLLVVSLWIGTMDAWLGAWVGYLTLRALPSPQLMSLETAMLAVLGAVMLIAVRAIPSTHEPWIVKSLEIAAVMEVCYVLVQWFGYDPLWAGLDQGPKRLVGTLGNSTYVACFLAMIVPIARLWMVPWLFVGIFLVGSVMGVLAALAGLLVTQRVTARAWLVCAVGAVAMLLTYGHVQSSWQTRWHVWQALLTDQTWWTVLVGHGPGSWILQAHVTYGEYFLQAHNEYLQLLYEGGLIAVLLLCAWLWFHQRRLMSSAWAGSVVAVSIASFTMFPFHLAIPGLTALVCLARSTAEEGATV